MKYTIEQLETKIMNLRDALHTAHAVAYSYKNKVDIIPYAVSERLAMLEVEMKTALDENKAW